MMVPKTAVYAVLAVALGYLLVSAVPNRLATMQRGTRPLPEGRDEAYGLRGEAAGSRKGVEPQLSPSSSGGVLALGLWMVDLLIALGVYFVVKRRLS